MREMDHDMTDPWLWLEDVDSDEALAWVREGNGWRMHEGHWARH